MRLLTLARSISHELAEFALFAILVVYNKNSWVNLPAWLSRACRYFFVHGAVGGTSYQFLCAYYGAWFRQQGQLKQAVHVWSTAYGKVANPSILLLFMLPEMRRARCYAQMVPFFEKDITLISQRDFPNKWRNYMMGYEIHQATGNRARAMELLNTAKQLAPNEYEFHSELKQVKQDLDLYWRFRDRFPD